ncbi:hypothetical protein FNH08_00405 [Streptomyces spongiae]|uniref:Uncharacterized protein n=1 Tax=Streptomyces spongiae TaxID=565072 RepID=A0A5N8XB03_9ACTN|nr:hypothetical protein [Streptomyces spongiae]
MTVADGFPPMYAVRASSCGSLVVCCPVGREIDTGANQTGAHRLRIHDWTQVEVRSWHRPDRRHWGGAQHGLYALVVSNGSEISSLLNRPGAPEWSGRHRLRPSRSPAQHVQTEELPHDLLGRGTLAALLDFLHRHTSSVCDQQDI